VLAAMLAAVTSQANDSPPEPDAANVRFQWGVRIPLRDGVKLSATAYLPKEQRAPAPCVFTLTPYIAQSYHDRGVYFAAHGYPFLTVDVRGRGNSEGEFRPLIQEANDGHDVVVWLSKQPYCNGKVAMWGGSYAGYNQWATAKEMPPQLATIAPAASPFMGADFPARNNIFSPYDLQWLTFTSGRTSQDRIFGDERFWTTQYRRLYESGGALSSFDTLVGNPSPIFQEWLKHPHVDAYWDRYNPTAEQYAKLELPILTITGSHDGDQPGALMHYREHMRHASPAARAAHYLIIGPWDHAGTRTPQAKFGGLELGPASLLDLPKLHLDWYAWTMQGGAKPQFLQKNVAYYVMGAEKWRYADTLDAVTAQHRAYFLASTGEAADVFASGRLGDASRGGPDRYRYDPTDRSGAALESTQAPELTDQRAVYARSGRQLVYHTEPFAQPAQISGFFKLSAWIAIDQPDTDFAASVYEVRADGSSIFMANDLMRARYRESLREPKLIRSREPLRYDFERFSFVSREVRAGSRLRLVIAPVDSIYSERNVNSGGEVAQETIAAARTVTVTLFHDRSRPSALYAPLGQPDVSD
jgi:putative CocE/NonD family hydrolase